LKSARTLPVSCKVSFSISKLTFCIFLAFQSPVHTHRSTDERGDNLNISQPPSLLHDTVMLLPTGINMRYSEIKQAGEGMYGIVYKAKDSTTGQLVAIKVMKGNVGGDALQAQCKKIEDLHKVTEVSQGPEIAHLMNCIEAQTQYVVYEWAGEEGSKLLPSLSFDAARALLKQVIMALHALSRATILHHDLKWQNVAIEAGCLKLIDLDGWIFGQWGNRFHKTVHSSLCSPPEILKRRRPENYFCGLTESAAEAQGGAEAVCPGAYSFDIYSAGMMALQICGFEWMFFANFMQEDGHVQQPAIKVEQQREMKRFAAWMGHLYDSIPFYGIIRLKAYLLQGNKLRNLLKFNPDDILRVVQNFKEETMCNSLASETYKAKYKCDQAQFKMDDAILMSHAQFAKKKFKSCKTTLTTDAVDIIESMLHNQPQQRPNPSRLLNSELFTGVPTNCPYDSAEGSFQESDRVPTEMTEEEQEEQEGQASAISENMIDELKKITASNEPVYYANSMNEHIEEDMDKREGSRPSMMHMSTKVLQLN